MTMVVWARCSRTEIVRIDANRSYEASGYVWEPIPVTADAMMRYQQSELVIIETDPDLQNDCPEDHLPAVRRALEERYADPEGMTRMLPFRSSYRSRLLESDLPILDAQDWTSLGCCLPVETAERIVDLVRRGVRFRLSHSVSWVKDCDKRFSRYRFSDHRVTRARSRHWVEASLWFAARGLVRLEGTLQFAFDRFKAREVIRQYVRARRENCKQEVRLAQFNKKVKVLPLKDLRLGPLTTAVRKLRADLFDRVNDALSRRGIGCQFTCGTGGRYKSFWWELGYLSEAILAVDLVSNNRPIIQLQCWREFAFHWCTASPHIRRMVSNHRKKARTACFDRPIEATRNADNFYDLVGIVRTLDRWVAQTINKARHHKSENGRLQQLDRTVEVVARSHDASVMGRRRRPRVPERPRE